VSPTLFTVLRHIPPEVLLHKHHITSNMFEETGCWCDPVVEYDPLVDAAVVIHKEPS